MATVYLQTVKDTSEDTCALKSVFYSSAHEHYFLFAASGQDLSITCNKKSLACNHLLQVLFQMLLFSVLHYSLQRLMIGRFSIS